jgi:outer membrane lipopolysaccharide assembly protein LptE/RlpB
MFKISLIIFTLFLSACGFHTPNKNTNLNVSIISHPNNIFANLLKTRLNSNALQILRIEIGAEKMRLKDAAYTDGNQVRSYNLNLSVPIQVFKGKTLLSTTVVSAKIYLNKALEEQADHLQVKAAYQQLRGILVQKVLRRLTRLNEN